MEEELQTLQKTADLAREIAVNYGFQFLAALIILIIGWQVSRWVSSLVLKLCDRFSLDITLSRFFAGLAKTIVLAFVFIIALGKFGISIAPFIAALGAVVFGSTLALQGPISNYGAGLTIVLTRPFVVGDTIRINNVIGIVEEIKLAYTLLSNEDGEQITIPNNRIIGEIIYNSSKNLIVEQLITISYEDDPEKVTKIILGELNKHNSVVSDPQVQVGIEQLSKFGIEIGLRYWIPTEKYFQLKYDINKNIYAALLAADISIPYQKHIIRMEN
ncbi:MAG: mechanosensitive ion channel family protein [Proteobacteria bacterium]|nr:mechanosensitive ion channel family protein [Pseudomonadota bacterium]NOG61097.1 mechanosensitive ion channel family protein [Pseudomonadota bacterium]